MRSPRSSVCTSLLIFCSLVPSSYGSFASTQSDKASAVTFNVRKEDSLFPVRITHIFVGQQEILPGSPTLLPGKWLGRIRILVQNTSPKEIVAGTVTITFPETGTGGPDQPVLSSGINLGRVPTLAFRHKDGSLGPIPDVFKSKPEIKVAPGGVMEFEMDPARGSAEQDQIYRVSGKISTVNIQTNSFYFADGSKWTGFGFFAPAQPPEAWKRITSEDFWGEKVR